MSSPLLQERLGSVMVCTLNRIRRRNSLDLELLNDLGRAVREASADPGVHVMVLTGAGDYFCAGGDLADVTVGLEANVLEQQESCRLFSSLLKQIAGASFPIIAAVNGDALGGGIGLVAACHLVVSHPRAHFGTPELGVGLFPMMVYPLLLRNMPRKIVAELVLTGRKLSADEARTLGLVNHLHSDALSSALELANGIASRPKSIVSLGLRAAAMVSDLSLTAALDHMEVQLTLNLHTEDAAEGISAFLERRAPEWKGC